MQEILLKIRYFETRLSKTLQKVNFIFFSNPVPFNGQSYQKQKRPGTSDHSLFRLKNKFKSLHLQIYASQCMTSLIIPLSFVLLILEKVERKRKKYQNLQYLENKKSFLDEIKNIFHSV